MHTPLRTRTFQLSLATFILLCGLNPNANAYTPRPKYKLSYQTKQNYIVHKSVCRNYASGSIEQRHCRLQAKVYFKTQCKTNRKLEKKIAFPQNRSYRLKALRFCAAAKTFNPLSR